MNQAVSQRERNAQATRSHGGLLLVSNYSNRTGYAWNNIHRLFEEIALHCRDHGHPVSVSFADFHGPLDWKAGNIFNEILELPPVPRSFSDLRSWIRAIRRHKWNSIYFTDQGCWGWRFALFRLAGVSQIIVHCRISVADPRPAIPSKGPRAWAHWMLCRLPLVGVTRVYAVSNFVRDRLVKTAQCPPGRVVTILNGIDLSRFSPASTEVERNTQEPLQIFCGGRATMHKGIHILISAAALLRDEHGVVNFEILYAGDGPDLGQFRRLVDSLNLGTCFRFLGQLPSTEGNVRDADIIVVPSIWGDACPSAIAEALGAGKPLVATRVGGVPEMIGDSGAALMVEPDDAMELANALAQLCTDSMLRLQLASLARRRAEVALDVRRYHNQVVRQLFSDIGIGRTRGCV